MAEQCRDCKFYAVRSDDDTGGWKGFCRRYPPRFKIDRSITDGFPNVHGQSCCGEFNPRIPPEQEGGGCDRFFKHGDTTVNLDDLRAIHVVKANPCGGAPHRDAGVLTYADSSEIRVSVEFATELTVFLSGKEGE